MVMFDTLGKQRVNGPSLQWSRLAQTGAWKDEVPHPRSHGERQSGIWLSIFFCSASGTRTTRCASPSVQCLTRGRAQETPEEKGQQPYTLAGPPAVSASLARDLPSCRQAQSPHTREGAGKTLRWQSTARFSFKCYFSYLVGIPAPTLGSKAPSSFPALHPLISPSPKLPVHLSANSCLSLVPTRS